MSDQHFRDEAAHRSLVAQLRAASSSDGSRVASRLQPCSFVAPCNSGACPLCGRALQIVAMRINKLAIRDPALASLQGHTTTLTIQPALGRVTPSSLSAATYVAALEEVQRILWAARIPVALGGIEALFNEVVSRGEEEHWQVLSRVNLRGWLDDEQEEDFHRLVAVTNPAPGALRILRLNAEEAGRADPFKPERSRRCSSSCLGREHYDRDRALRLWQRLSLAPIEHDFGLWQRLLIHGVSTDAVRRALVGFEWLARSVRS